VSKSKMGCRGRLALGNEFPYNCAFLDNRTSWQKGSLKGDRVFNGRKGAPPSELELRWGGEVGNFSREDSGAQLGLWIRRSGEGAVKGRVAAQLSKKKPKEIDHKLTPRGKKIRIPEQNPGSP